MDKTELGHLLTGTEGRDAIHVAVTPMEAAEMLKPGQRVCVIDGKGYPCQSWVTNRRTFHGVVDPYLEDAVLTGQRFYLCLPPGTVTSLRHVWTHPDFPTRGVVNESRS